MNLKPTIQEIKGYITFAFCVSTTPYIYRTLTFLRLLCAIYLRCRVSFKDNFEFLHQERFSRPTFQYFSLGSFTFFIYYRNANFPDIAADLTSPLPFLGDVQLPAGLRLVV